MNEMVRIYYYGDNGPYGDYVEADPKQTYASDGWGVTEIHLIPLDVWERYLNTKDAFDKATAEIDALVDGCS